MILSPSRAKQRRHARSQKAHSRLEAFEPRLLLTAALAPYALPSGFQALAGTYDDNDNLWVVDAGSLDKVVNHNFTVQVALPDPGFGASPVSVLAGHNGHMYVLDSAGQIDDFDTASSTFVATYTWDVGANGDFAPTAATITGDNAVWFVTHGTSVTTVDGSNQLLTDQRTSYIGRFDPNNVAGGVVFTTINDFDPTVTDSQATTISAHGNDAVYVGMGVLNEPTAGGNRLFGTNRIVTASFHTDTNIAMVDHVYTLSDNNSNATFGFLTSIATSTNGDVWFALGNSSTGPSPTQADTINHGVISLDGNSLGQTSYIVPGSDAHPVDANNLATDSAGRIWFNELLGTHVGYYDSVNNVFNTDVLTYPADVTEVGQIFASHTLNEVSMIVVDNTPDDGSPLAKVTFTNDAQTFVNFTATLAGNHVEDVAQTLNVNFTASAPVSGPYQVAINWGDGSAIDSVNATGVSGQYTASHNHTYASQNTYTITVTVTDGTQPSHSLTINPVISDVPLQVTSFATTNILSRIFVSTMTFTDDIDATASQFTVTINWGDGTSSRGLVIRDPFTPGRFLVIALHQFAKKGTYHITATVTTTEVNAAVTSNTATSTVTAH